MTRKPKLWTPREWPEAVPRFHTKRNLDRDTLGPELVEVSRNLGYEPMPWQRDVWDVQYELDESGNLWYREARITVPRQSAKTTSTLVRQVDRSINSEERGWGRRPVCLFTMQFAADARNKIIYDWVPDIEDSDWAMERLEKISRANGREGFFWLNGARMATFPPNASGAHGGTVDLVDIDEAFAFPDDRAEQGSRPAMITRPSPQLCVQSTAGTDTSLYLLEKVNDGRERVTAGEDTHVMYVEYSIGPDDDIDNPDHWPRWMPALGYTQSMDAMKLEHDAMKPDAFYRAYGNGWTRTGRQIIPAEKWKSSFEPKTPRTGSVWMSADAAPGDDGKGRSGSISIASYRGDDVHVETIAHGPGISWMPDKIAELTKGTGVDSLWIDPTGPIGSILPDIRLKSHARIEEVDVRTVVNACARFHQAVLDRKVHHRNQDVLNAAVEGADKRTLEDGWAWKRRTSTTDISPLVTCTLAHWAAIVNRDQGLIGMHVARKQK